jgi:hypothetical protein
LQFGVFLSHSEEDERLAWRVKDVLDRTKIDTYIFEAYQKPGEALVDAVTTAMKNSSYVVVILTKNSSNSPWVNQEIGMAHGLGKEIIPVVENNLIYKGLIEFRTKLPFQLDTTDKRVGSVADEGGMIYLLLRRLRELLNRCEEEKDALTIKCPYCSNEFRTILPSCEDIDRNLQKFLSLVDTCPSCHNDVSVNPFTFDQYGVPPH